MLEREARLCSLAQVAKWAKAALNASVGTGQPNAVITHIGMMQGYNTRESNARKS